jgi:hypothetical protein
MIVTVSLRLEHQPNAVSREPYRDERQEDVEDHIRSFNRTPGAVAVLVYEDYADRFEGPPDGRLNLPAGHARCFACLPNWVWATIPISGFGPTWRVRSA